MALPAGVTRFPRRSITYTTQPTFPLAGRLGNLAAADIANPGNVWVSGGTMGQKPGALLERVMDDGNLMAVVLGNDVRNWVRITSDVALGNANECLRPNSVYWMSRSSNTDVIVGTNVNGFKPGDRVTIVNLGTGRMDFYLASVRVPTGAITSRIRLKGSNPGASVTLEYGYLETITPTLGWHLVQWNGTLGDLVDGNPIGLS